MARGLRWAPAARGDPIDAGFELWDGAWHHVSLVVPDNYYYQMSALIDRRWTTFTPHPPTFSYASMATDALAVGRPRRVSERSALPRRRRRGPDLRHRPRRPAAGGLLPPVPSTLGLTSPSVGAGGRRSLLPGNRNADAVLRVRDVQRHAPIGPGDAQAGRVGKSDRALPRVLRPGGRDLPDRCDLQPGLAHQDSSGQPITLTVSRRPTQVINVGGRDFLSTEPIRIEATVAATDGYPTGPVEFFDTTGGGRTLLGAADLQWLGTAGHETAFLDLPARQPGTYTLEADYPGTAERFLPSIGTGSVTVTRCVRARRLHDQRRSDRHLGRDRPAATSPGRTGPSPMPSRTTVPCSRRSCPR